MPLTPINKETALALDRALSEIHDMMGLDYEVTLVCRYIGPGPYTDADLIVGAEHLDKTIDTIKKMKHRKPTYKPGDRL